MTMIVLLLTTLTALVGLIARSLGSEADDSAGKTSGDTTTTGES